MINVCEQHERIVVQRFGKFSHVEWPGLFLAIPFVDELAFVVDTREMAITIEPQAAFTRDNVSVNTSGALFVKFVDPEKAAYGSSNPLFAASQLAQACMRSAVGNVTLDDLLHNRSAINASILSTVREAVEKWGLEVRRYEITEVLPDHAVMKAMDRQSVAERQRRERVLEANGERDAAILKSEGVRMALKNESEGEMIRVTNEAEANKRSKILAAEAEAESIRLSAEASAFALERISKTLTTFGAAKDAAQLSIAQDYIRMYGQMAGKSNTMIFSDRPGNVNALMAQAAAALSATVEQQRAKTDDTEMTRASGSIET